MFITQCCTEYMLLSLVQYQKFKNKLTKQINKTSNYVSISNNQHVLQIIPHTVSRMRIS